MRFLNDNLPRCCILCEHYCQGGISLCTPCQTHLPHITHACERCAIPLASTEQTLCGQCIQAPPAFDRAISLYRYESPISTMIHELKFSHRFACAQALGSVLGRHISTCYSHDQLPECLIPIPLHTKRLRQRGFNQAIEIARPIARHLSIRMDVNSSYRQRATQEQMHVPLKHRKRNVKKAFYAKPLPYQHIAIIDDVITTGNTVNALSECLKQQGVRRVDVWSIARTPRN